jgi:molybdopterin/thiamine biosynthesis adenylyltransferase/DNA-binding transcriptional regulator YhcF (GntR family)
LRQNKSSGIIWYGGQTTKPEIPVSIKPISHRTLSEVVAGKLAASILDQTLKAGAQLDPERELMLTLGVSRSTLREALKVLADNHLIDARPGIGWFVCPIREDNYARAHELAGADRQATPPMTKPIPASSDIPTGPRRLPVSSDKPLHIPNLQTDRLGTFDFISWWEREKVTQARVLVVGAGALGNEVIKNLALMGIGHLYIVDFDTIEAANLSRSPLFRESDSGRRKAEVAAARAKEINPNIHVQYLHGDITARLGLGVIRRMDVIIGCLDNREARLALNRFAYWMNKPWVDGAIQELLGLVRVFVPGQGACFECTLTEQARRDLAVRYSCPLFARQNVLLGKVPTTPTIASIIGAMQAQEALKLLHGMPVEAGKVIHFNGMTNEMHTSAYRAREDCESHWTYGEITELPARAETTTLQELLGIARADLGPSATLELDQELIVALECPQCKTITPVLQPMNEVTFEAAHCPSCGTLREAQLTHNITGEEPFLNRSLASLSVPKLSIIRALNQDEYRFYELTGDLDEALHFRDFEPSAAHPRSILRERLAKAQEIPAAETPSGPAHGKVRLHD